MANSVPSEMQNDVKTMLNSCTTKFPRAWSKCHKEGDPEAWDFIILAARELDGLINKNSIVYPSHVVGCNGKRGSNELSMDALAFQTRGSSDVNDVRVVDVVGGAGGASPSIVFADVTLPNVLGKIIDPFTRFIVGPEGSNNPSPNNCENLLKIANADIERLKRELAAKPTIIPYDESKSVEFGKLCNELYDKIKAGFDPGMISVFSSRAAWDHYVGGLSWEVAKRKQFNDFRAVYGLGPV